MSIHVCPFEAVEAVLADLRPSHAVSLFSPGKGAPDCLAASSLTRLELCFHDITEPREGHVAPSLPQVRELIGFLQAWDGARPILIHCWAGISRSTAAAYIAACLREGPGAEVVLADRLRRAAPFATPNALIIAHADQILRRHGAMIGAVAAIGRGAEAALGQPFSF